VTTEGHEERADALLSRLGFAEWRPGQREAVAAAIGGRDSLIVMPTGGGKSLCYQLPGLATEDLTIVVSPLIALINDQWKRLTDAGHPVAMVSSAMDERDVRLALTQVRGDARIVYCAPERFASPVFLEALAQRRVDLLAVDEAHCVSEWGHDFRPDYLRLPEVAQQLGRPTVMACTATATEEVAEEIVECFGLRDPLQIRAGFDRPNLSFDVVRLEGKGSKRKRQGLLEAGLSEEGNRPAIVYCGTRKDTEEIARELRGAGRRALHYHAGMEPEARNEAQRRFMTDEIDVIVATNAFGMGVDKADVRSVWHMAIPTSLEAYYQEAGRAGRDGQPAKAVMLALRSDLGRLVRFNEKRDPELEIARERGWRDLRTIRKFIHASYCRRSQLLSHFGDHSEGEPVGRCCDHCAEESLLPNSATTSTWGPGRMSPSAASPALTAADSRLFERLREWRRGAAGAEPVYMVARNETLEAIAAARPLDADALAAIKGIGPSFVSKYASEILAIVANDGAQLAL
jgi:RecQ family ATP-dependent DNA helicase